jgi:hypothetical protein
VAAEWPLHTTRLGGPLPGSQLGDIGPPSLPLSDRCTLVRWQAERTPSSMPKGINTSDLISCDRVGERSCTDAVNVAAIIDQATGCLDGLLGGWKPPDVVQRVPPILDVPSHRFAQWRQTPYAGKIVFLLTKRLPPYHPLLVQGPVELVVDALERVLDRGTAPDGRGAPARRINAP